MSEPECPTPRAQAEELLKRAAQYRRAARGPVPWAVAESLERWAADCEREAAALLAEPPQAA